MIVVDWFVYILARDEEEEHIQKWSSSSIIHPTSLPLHRIQPESSNLVLWQHPRWDPLIDMHGLGRNRQPSTLNTNLDSYDNKLVSSAGQAVLRSTSS